MNGVTISLMNHFKALKDSCEIALFAPRLRHGRVSVPDYVRFYEFRSVPFPSYPGYNIGLVDYVLPKALKEFSPTIIHTHSPFSLGYWALLSRRVLKVPLVATFHTWLSEYVGHLFGGFAEEKIKALLNSFSWMYTKWYFDKADLILTPSQLLKYELKRHHLTSEIMALPNPISDFFFTDKEYLRKEEHRKEIARRYNLPIDEPWLIYVGRISFEKRLQLLFHAFQKVTTYFNTLKHDKITPHLIIAGDGPQLRYYKRFAEKMQLENCTFLGYYPHRNLPKLYAAADIFVSPSDTETQGLTVIEAMSQGLPVIGTKAGGMIDYIRPNKNGLLIHPKNEKELVDAIIYLLENPNERKKMGNEALKMARHYNSETFKKRLHAAYIKALTINSEKNTGD